MAITYFRLLAKQYVLVYVTPIHLYIRTMYNIVHTYPFRGKSNKKCIERIEVSGTIEWICAKINLNNK